MLFNSLEFIVFFPLVAAFYFMLPHRFRWMLLLVASYYFYMCWNCKYVVLLLFTTLVSYICGIGLHKARKQGVRSLLLVLSLLIIIGVLFFFKYFNFFGNSLNNLFSRWNLFIRIPAFHYLLPIGISFYTFQAVSYIIDVYRDTTKPEYHPGRYALFISFFPKLIAGPIDRAQNLLPQISGKAEIDYVRIRDGLALALWGFFKKVVVAERVAEYVNLVYDNPSSYQGPHFLVATLFYTVQIYCDFSGYTDIARGSAKILGFDLLPNFRRPYLASTIRDFWQRWHITLSNWFRDYVFLPSSFSFSYKISKNRVLFLKKDVFIYIAAIVITWFLTGLWHGANWTFIIWGGLFGLYLIVANRTKSLRRKFNKVTRLDRSPVLAGIVSIVTTNILVAFNWIFFRANTVRDAFYIIGKMPSMKLDRPLNLFSFKVDFYISVVLIIFLMAVEIMDEKYDLYAQILKKPAAIKWALATVISLAIFVLGIWGSADFLYFQF